MPLPAFLAAALGPAIAAGGSALTQGGPKRQYKWNKRLAEDQNRMNRENQQWLLQQNKELQAEQREYDSARAQMARYKEAGLNPNLIYGQTPTASPTVQVGGMPGVNMGQVSGAYPDVAGNFIRASQAFAGIDLSEARTAQSAAQTALTQIQTDIAKTNPMLSPRVASAVAEMMMETAELKASESNYTRTAWTDRGPDESSRVYVAKIKNEVEAMYQKLGLNTADLAIKNRILESKEFENAIKEINARWLKDGDLSPEHIRQGMMLILNKMMGK